MGILFFSTIFNAALSLRRLMKVSALQISLTRHVALPLLWAAACVLLGKWALGHLPLQEPLALVALQCALCGGLFALGYGLLLGRDFDDLLPHLRKYDALASVKPKVAREHIGHRHSHHKG